jgi:hypothetical protein
MAMWLPASSPIAARWRWAKAASSRCGAVTPVIVLALVVAVAVCVAGKREPTVGEVGDQLRQAVEQLHDQLERGYAPSFAGGPLAALLGRDPELTHYQTPIQGLHLTGAGTYPGAGVSGAPGRNTATVVLAAAGHSRRTGNQPVRLGVDVTRHPHAQPASAERGGRQPVTPSAAPNTDRSFHA